MTGKYSEPSGHLESLPVFSETTCEISIILTLLRIVSQWTQTQATGGSAPSMLMMLRMVEN